MIERWLNYVMLFLVGVAIGFGWGWVHTKNSITRTQAVTVIEKAQDGAESARQARESREVRGKYRAKEKTQQEAAIDEATTSNPAWADGAVPDGVWDALGGK